jgi:hypothetical protein
VSLFVVSPEIEGRNEVEVGNCETGDLVRFRPAGKFGH